MHPSPIDVSKLLKQFAGEFDAHLERFLTAEQGVPAELAEAVRYAALAPGKRLRPFLVVSCCEVLDGDRRRAWAAAAAVECIHAFSLVHDDLPAMDNDAMRRGQPTTHKKFGEALGILAGDALVVRAFEIVAREYGGPSGGDGSPHPRGEGESTRRRGDTETAEASRADQPSLAGKIVLELARAAGWAGMIGGQADDLLGEAKPPSLELTQSIHRRKTAALFEASCRIGAVLAPLEARGDGKDTVAALGRFGLKLGEAFQIADDILDVTATAEELGKSPGKDVAAMKQTFPRCVGVEASKAAAQQAVQEALAELGVFGPKAEGLRALARYVADRNY